MQIFYIYFPRDNKNLTHIYEDHCAADGLTFSDFRTFFFDVWNSGKYNFVTLDLTRPEKKGRLNTTQHEKYTRISKPVTSPKEKLVPQPAPPVPDQAPPQPKQEIEEEEEDVKFFDEPNNGIFRHGLYEVPEN